MKVKIRETCIFGMLGVMMYVSRVALSALPNIHLLAFFIMSFTAIYRKKALYIVYTYVLVEGIMCGFALWWIPYLYLWTILWAASVILLKPSSRWYKFSLIGLMHGVLFGTLYAPLQMIMFNFSFDETIVWIAAGLPWDITHGISNAIIAMLCPTFVKLLIRLEKERWGY